MSVNKEHGQTEDNDVVLFQLLDSTGTPSITKVSPLIAAGDISVSDTGAGRATVTIKNFKGPQGAVNIQLTTRTTSVWASVASSSYSGDDFTFEISIENDASTLTDASVDVRAEAY